MTGNASNWVLYSTCDEDSESELRALQIQRGDDVLSVTGSGCRSLSLLTTQPRSLTTVDMDAGQNHLFQLKLAAIRHLDYEPLLAFLGISPDQKRLSTFERLTQALPSETVSYLRQHADKIEAGVIYSGRHEQFYRRLVAPMLRRLFGQAIDRAFLCTTLDEQRRLYNRRIRSWVWRLLIKRGFSVRILKKVLNNPGYNVEVHIPDPGSYILSRFDHAFYNHDLRNSDWMSVTLRGSYSGALPHFLRRENVERIKTAPTEVIVKNKDILSFCDESARDQYDKIALSDVTSCLSSEQFGSLITNIGRIGREGGRICYRNFLADYRLAAQPDLPFHRDDALCAELTESDRAFVYRFEVATILPESV